MAGATKRFVAPLYWMGAIFRLWALHRLADASGFAAFGLAVGASRVL
ncbi:MAG: hypothetical protein WA715_03720 [Candidatus Acidiferrum sp.]